MARRQVKPLDKPPLVLRIAIWLANPQFGDDGKPKLDMPLWWITSILYVFGNLILVFLFALLLGKVLPSFETLRHFLISSLIFIILLRLAFIEAHPEAVTDHFDISEFKYRHSLPSANDPMAFRKPFAIFRFIGLASIPALIAIVSGVKLLLLAAEWGLDLIF